MEEKNLVSLPNEVAEYLEYMKRNNYTLLGSLKVSCVTGKFTDYMEDYFSVGSNQEKFALAWVNGYKVKEKRFIVKVRNCTENNCLNYNIKEKSFFFNSESETSYCKTKFTRDFLEKNSFGWVFSSEGVELIEV